MSKQTYLWIQDDKLQSAATLVINNKVSIYNGSESQNLAMEKFSEVLSWKIVPYIKDVKNVLPNYFQLKSKSDDGYYISSCFSDLDEIGRKIPFQFYSNEKCLNDVIDSLRKCASAINYNLVEDQLEIIKNACDEYKKKIIIMWGILITLVIVLVFLTIQLT